jgi:hypothetical protein
MRNLRAGRRNVSDEGASNLLVRPKRSLYAAVSSAALFCSAPAFASSCEDLTNLTLADMTIETAETRCSARFVPTRKKAWYKGGGNPNIAAGYTCAVENK